MNYTEATRLSRQMSGGMTKTALEGWQRAGLGATGGGLLAYTMASLINPSMSRRGKLLSTLAGMGTGAAAGYRFLPGYGSGKTTAGAGNGGNAANATTDTGTSTTQSPAKSPAQTAAKTPAKTQTKAPAQTQAPAPAKTPAQTATQAPAQEVAPAENLGSLGATPAVEPAPAATPAPAPAPAPTATPATAPTAAPAAPDQEYDDVSGTIYSVLAGLGLGGLGITGASLVADNMDRKDRRVRQFGARRQQVREDQDTYAAWNAALEELARRPQVEMPPTAQQAPAQTQAPSATQGRTQAKASGKGMWKGHGKMSIRRRASGARVLALLAGLAPALYGSLDRD